MKSLPKVLFIFASLCVVSLPTYLYLYGKKETKPKVLTTLIQKTSFSTPISPRFFSDYLMLNPSGKWLEISKLDETKIENKLKEFPIFDKIQAHILSTGELEIAYDLKKPQFLLADFTNLAIDPKGSIFPLRPFFPPKKIPQVYLGIQSIDWKSINNIKKALQIQKILDEILDDEIDIEMIDLSNQDHKVSSLKQIVVTLSYKGIKHYLRLSPDHLEKALLRYLTLYKENDLNEFLSSNLVFDARFKKFATLKMLP
jgi:hypothetical protein